MLGGAKLKFEPGADSNIGGTPPQKGLTRTLVYTGVHILMWSLNLKVHVHVLMWSLNLKVHLHVHVHVVHVTQAKL